LPWMSPPAAMGRLDFFGIDSNRPIADANGGVNWPAVG
jgi:hypothetical protein